ncbi:MAG TPA: hypothetical protein VHW25_07750 [Steroidobacteraceae bacterium]|jgi:hypothetical protein|nr:hypothetical protein [Steroidobacteraceae bacterium]
MRKAKAIWVASVLAASLAYALCAAADCLLPAPPSHIPDGTSANEHEMLTAMRTLKQYNDDVNEYTRCLEFQQRQNRISFEDREKRRDDALNLLATVAARFNEQVRRFKARRS